MKADDYVAMFIRTEKDEGPEKAIWKVVTGMLDEIKVLLGKRKVQSRHGITAVIDELHVKWIAIAKRLKKHKGIDVIYGDGFKKMLVKIEPVLEKFM